MLFVDEKRSDFLVIKNIKNRENINKISTFQIQFIKSIYNSEFESVI